jgi:hypothetical protein
MSANTAIHKVATPKSASTKKTALIPIDSAMLVRKVRPVARLRRTSSGTPAQVIVHQRHVGGLERGVESRRPPSRSRGRAGQRWSVVDAVADHADAARAPPSASMMASFWRAAGPRRRSSIPTARATAAAVVGLSPVSMASSMSSACSSRMAAMLVCAQGVGDAEHAEHLRRRSRPPSPTCRRPRARASSRSTSGPTDFMLLDEAMAADRQRAAIDHAAESPTDLVLYRPAPAGARPSSRGPPPAPGGASRSLRGSLRAAERIACRRPPSGTTSVSSGRPSVSVPVLSSARKRRSLAPSRWDAALDQDPAPRRRRERRDDRHRRRDDERARARDDEQDERLVDPRVERSPPPMSGGRNATRSASTSTLGV